MSIPLTNIPSRLSDSVDVDVRFRGHFDQPSASLHLFLPDGLIVGTTRVGAATCTTAGFARFRIAAEEFLAQRSANGALELRLRPQTITVPPGRNGDGVTPCDPDAVTGDGQNDGVTGVSVVVTYRTLYPDYFTTGATVTPRRTTSAASPDPTVVFNQGVTEFFYVVTDQGGNQDTCSFAVTVRDTTAPIARCLATTVMVDPSGLEPVTLDPMIVGGTSTDNCGIDTMTVSPNVFACDQYGETATVRLTVRDASGNQDTCSTIISVAPLAPAPSAATTLCGGDTLILRANPPTAAAPGQTIYTFQWFGPDGTLISTQENPVIPGVDESDEGAYRVVIRGLTGCEAEGVVIIDIGNTPEPPAIIAPFQVCEGENVPLASTTAYAGAVRYEWYRGQPGAGVFLGQSTTTTFSAAFADATGSADFYAVAFVNGCASAPSNVVTVGRTTQPVVSVPNQRRSACELGGITLTAEGPESLGYTWTGPNNFLDVGRSIRLEDISLDDAGTYEVRSVRGGGCFSEPATVELIVTPADAPTELEPVPTVCASDTLILRAVDRTGRRYVFRGPNDLEFETDGPELRIAPVSPRVVGNWTVSIERGICLSAPSLPMEVRLGRSPIVRAETIPDPVCEGNDLLLQGASNTAGSIYQWTGPNDFAAVGIAVLIENVNAGDAGEYVLNVTAPTGCQRNDTIQIDILPGLRIDSITVASAACLIGGEPVSLSATVTPVAGPGEDYTFEWNGPEGGSANDTFRIPNLSLASNGRYSVIATNEAGCRTPRFVDDIEFDFAPATPVPPFTTDGRTGFCAGADFDLTTTDYGAGTTYLWTLPDGTVIPTTANTLPLRTVGGSGSGAYTVRVLRSGCTSLPSEPRQITVTEFPSLNVMANDPACEGMPINFQATDLAGAAYTWSGPNNFSSSLPNPTIVSADSTVHAGVYSVFADLAGCRSDTSFVTVEIRPTPATPVVEPIESICISDSNSVLRLSINPNTATPGATYQWFIRNSGVRVGAPTADLTLELTDLGLFSGGGDFDFTVSAIVDACPSFPSAPVVVSLDAIPDLGANAGRDTVVCEGLFVLNAVPTTVGTGRWTLVAGTGDIDIINPGQPTTAVQGLTQNGGPYRFAWTLSNGSCGDFASDTIQLTVTDGEVADAGENIVACLREEVRLDAVAPVLAGSTGEWTQALAQELLGIEIANPNDPNTIIRGLRPDNIYSFVWTVRSSCGVKEDVVVVNVSDPSPFAGEDQTACNEERSAELAADPPTLGSRGRWRPLDDRLSVAEPDSARTRVTGLQPGDNILVWEVDGGSCGDRSRDTLVVRFNTPPEPEDDRLSVDFQGTVTFDPTANDNNPADAEIAFLDVPAGGLLTMNGDGTVTLQAPPNFVGELTVDYLVTSDGCTTGSATVFVQVGDNAECQPPNIFTPNGDGMNDAFVVPCLLDTDRFNQSEVVIYNEWGDEVYRSGQPYRNDWDGTWNGEQLPVGEYFYTIDFGDGRAGVSGAVRIER